MDRVSPAQRSWNMSRVAGKNTKPEILVRSLLHRMGYRFRLHSKKLPGKPDIVLPKYKKVIFVHGCFWHGHNNCNRAKIPTTRPEFWTSKINKNKERDCRILSEIEKLGFGCLVIWQCETKDVESLRVRLFEFLGKD